MITMILLVAGCAVLGYFAVIILLYIIEFIVDFINLLF